MLAIPEEPADVKMLSTSPVFLRDALYSNFSNFISSTTYLEDNIAAEVECSHNYGDRDYFYSESMSATTSCATSIASSEFSDDGYVDIEDVALNPFLDGMDCNLDFSNTAMHGIKKKVMEWNSGLKGCTKSSAENSSASVVGSKRKFESELDLKPSVNRARCACRNMRRKIEELTWSEMSSDDQVDTVEYLTRVVSMTMGLREQLEIIRIINPDARVLATDTEFVIDLDTFDNYKFQRIRHFVAQHLAQDDCPLCSDTPGSLSSCSSSSSHRKYSKRRNVKPLSTKRISRKSTKHKGVLARVHRQMQKERRSGLFQNEEVISLNSSDHSPDDTQDVEIDILS